MAEYTNNAVQTVAVGGSALFTEGLGGCSCGIMHRAGSGLFQLRGPGRYRITFNGNLAVPTGGTPGAVSVGVSLDSETLYSSIATVTPAAVEEYFNVTSTATACVPCGCCAAVTIKNAGGQAVNVANPNLIIERA